MATDAFAQGKLAFEHNHPMSSCDYPAGSSLRAEWMAGWTEANNTRPNANRSAMPEPTHKASAERAEHRM
jgi:hypothetical protein